jgi:hypothetical protein
MNELSTPMVSITGEDEAVPFSQELSQVHAKLPTPRNCAADVEVMDYVTSTLAPVLDWTRLNRGALEEEWRAIRRMELMTHDSNQRYKGRSNAYLPVYLRALNTQVAQLSKGLFPSDEYMDVVSRHSDAQASLAAKAVKAYLQYDFDRVAKLRSNIKPFLRQLVAYGNSVIKFDYRKKPVMEGRAQQDGEYAFLPTMYEGLRVSTRSIFNTYVYPMTADSMDEVAVLFEDIDVPRSFIDEQFRLGRWLKTEKDSAQNAPEPSQHQMNRQELLSTGAGSSSTVGPMTGSKLDVRTLSEVWVYMKLPKDQYLPGEDPASNLLAKVIMAGTTAVEVIRCPFFHQRIPYLWARQNTSPGLFYGHLVGRAIAPAQYLANDFANQTNDCGNYALNPIVKVNPGMMAGPMPPLAPGRVIPLTNIDEGMKFDRPPGELIQWGSQITNQWIGYGQDLSGTPPVLQGAADAGTATSTQILQRNASAPLQDVVEDLENDVMEPLMYGAWCNAQQFRDGDVMTQVAGTTLKVTPKDLIIDADFRWLAANQAANQQQRASQTVQFLQALEPLIPVLAQQGKQVNVEPLLERMYVDGMGFRNWDQIIVPAPPPPPPMPGQPPGQPGMPPGAPPSPGGVPAPQAPLSALSQIPGAGNQPMAPGEGDDYGAVRDQANELAAMAGGNNGK